MIDRIWRLCQLRHPTAGMPPELLAEALPFNITVRQTVNVNWLGYDYASFSSRTTVARSCDGDHCGPRAALRRASDVVRADLTFYGLDHSGPSYGVRVFLDLPDATTETPLDDSHYADSFTVFGHGGCFGDEGHCDVRPAVTTFDRRPPHQLVLAVRVLTCTKPIKRLIADGRASVNATVVAIVRESPLADPQAADDLPHADQIALHRYE